MDWIKKLIQIQKSRRISWAELARTSGVSPKSLERWRTKGRAPKGRPVLDNAVRLARALEVSMDVLYFDEIELPKELTYQVMSATHAASASGSAALTNVQVRQRKPRDSRLILLAPLACWSLLSRILKVQQAMLNELRLLNAMIRNRGQRHEPSPPQATASSSRAHAPPGSH